MKLGASEYQAQYQTRNKADSVFTEAEARCIARRLSAGKDYPPSFASIQRVLDAALELGIILEGANRVEEVVPS